MNDLGPLCPSTGVYQSRCEHCGAPPLKASVVGAPATATTGTGPSEGTLLADQVAQLGMALGDPRNSDEHVGRLVRSSLPQVLGSLAEHNRARGREQAAKLVEQEAEVMALYSYDTARYLRNLAAGIRAGVAPSTGMDVGRPLAQAGHDQAAFEDGLRRGRAQGRAEVVSWLRLAAPYKDAAARLANIVESKEWP